MNDDPRMKANESLDDAWETTVRDTARHFDYPTTPDISRQVRARLTQRRAPITLLKIAAAVVFALLIVATTVPEVRAFVVEVIRIGAIQIFVGQPTPTPVPTARPTASAYPTSTDLYLQSALEMPNETTLEDAVAQLKSPINLPTYPVNIGKPNHVYVQQFKPGVLVTLVWTVPDNPDKIWLTLDILSQQMIASKFIYDDGKHQSVKVNQTSAEWIPSAHEVVFFGNNQQITREVHGTVLIWSVGQTNKLTYRLEGASTLEEALQMAESFGDAGTP